MCVVSVTVRHTGRKCDCVTYRLEFAHDTDILSHIRLHQTAINVRECPIPFCCSIHCHCRVVTVSDVMWFVTMSLWCDRRVRRRVSGGNSADTAAFAHVTRLTAPPDVCRLFAAFQCENHRQRRRTWTQLLHIPMKTNVFKIFA